MTHDEIKVILLENISDKLSDLKEYVGEATINVEKCLNDALREQNKIMTDIDPATKYALGIELRALYYALKKVGLSFSKGFKYDTGNEGKMVDKTDQFKAINKLIHSYDKESLEVLGRGSTPIVSTATLPSRTKTEFSDYS